MYITLLLRESQATYTGFELEFIALRTPSLPPLYRQRGGYKKDKSGYQSCLQLCLASKSCIVFVLVSMLLKFLQIFESIESDDVSQASLHTSSSRIQACSSSANRQFLSYFSLARERSLSRYAHPLLPPFLPFHIDRSSWPSVSQYCCAEKTCGACYCFFNKPVL